MKQNLPVVLLAVIIATAGCGRKRQETSLVDNVSATSTSTDQATISTTNEAAQPLDGPADPGLTVQLRIFIQEHGRLPADFAEFSRARLDSVPRVPQGLKWAIDPVTQEVKLVKQ